MAKQRVLNDQSQAFWKFGLTIQWTNSFLKFLLFKKYISGKVGYFEFFMFG